MFGVSVHDVEELNNKLVSDKAKVREDGLKILQSYLHSTGETSLWTLLDEETARLDQHGRIRSSTWPGILHALCLCIENEVAASKRKVPKTALAKTLRSFVLKAEDTSRPGQNLSLLRKVKRLFQHVLEILQRVPSYVSDYNNILCQLLHVFEYRTRMGKKIYSDLLHFYMEKAKEISRTITTEVSLAKEEAFRNTSSLHSLLQHPPGDFPDVLLVNIVDDFIEIFMHLGDEGRIAKKLLASLNSFLLMNGLNIGAAAGNIHASIKTFMFRVWLTTRDRELKDGLVLYARIQLQLRYILDPDESHEVSNLLELVEKELDQSGVALSALYRLDVVREEKPSAVSRTLRSFLELASAVLYEAIISTQTRQLRDGKRRRKTDICTVIRDRLMDGKFLWSAAFCLLIRKFGAQLSADVILGWLEGLSSSLDRIMLEGINARIFEGPLWTLRCLQELAYMWWKIFPPSTKQSNCLLASQRVKAEIAWSSIWNSLLHSLPLLNNEQVMVEEAFRLLGVLAAQGVVPICSLPHEFWEIHRFDEVPSGNLLFFIAAFFGSTSSQIVANDVKIRGKLLDWCMSSLEAQDVHRTRYLFGEQISPKLLSAAVLALAFGVISGSSGARDTLQEMKKELSWPSLEANPYLEADDSDRGQEMELAALDRSHSVLVGTEDIASPQDQSIASKIQLPPSISDFLLGKTADHLLRHAVVASDVSQTYTLAQLLHLSSVLAICIEGVRCTTERRGQIPSEWSPEGALWLKLASILDRGVKHLYEISGSFTADSCALLAQRSTLTHLFSSSSLDTLQQYVSYAGSCTFVATGGVVSNPKGQGVSQPVLEKLLKAACKVFTVAKNVASVSDKAVNSANVVPITIDFEKPSQETVGGKRIVDLDLDVNTDTGLGGGGTMSDISSTQLTTRSLCTSIIRERNGDWRSNAVQFVAIIGKVLPDATCATLMDLLLDEEDPKVHEDILLSLCKMMSSKTPEYLPAVVRKIQDLVPECLQSETTRCLVLMALDGLFNSLLGSEKRKLNCPLSGNMGAKGNFSFSEEVSTDIAELIEKVADMGLIFWSTRVKLLEVLSGFIVLDPNAAQVLIEKFLVLLHDSEYQVRLCLSRRVAVLFETWDGHDELLPDVCTSFGVKIATMSADHGFVAGETIRSPHQVAMAETALLSLGEIAISSEKVESNVVFMICAHLATNPQLRDFGCSIINKVANRLKYPNRWKYIEQLAGQLVTYWVMANIDVSALLEVREVLVESSDTKEFFQQFCPWLLPALVYFERNDQISWLAAATSLSVPELVKQHFVSIFAGILPLHLGSSKGVQKRAAVALQVSMLTLADITEDERDELIQKQMVSIVCVLFGLCSAREKPVRPYFTKETVVTSVKTVVDGFMESEQVSQDDKLIDKMQIFRADRVFLFLLQLHQDLVSARHPRHRVHMLTSLRAMLEVLDLRLCVPSTCRYIILIILQSMEVEDLQRHCCETLAYLLDKLYSSGVEGCFRILGEQLQVIVSKLVSFCITLYRNGETPVEKMTSPHKLLAINGDPRTSSSSVIALLRKLTVGANESLHVYIKDLDPFPSMPCFEQMRTLQEELSFTYTLAEEFVQFVRRAPKLSTKDCVSSLKNLCDKLSTRRMELYDISQKNQKHEYWRCSPLVVDAVWRLIHLCERDDEMQLNDLAGEFLAAVGVGDPHAVVFHLPEKIHEYHTSLLHESPVSQMETRHIKDVSVDPELGLSDDLLKSIVLQLRSYLTDSDVGVIQLAYKTLKGVLSTERGQTVFLSMDTKEKTYLEMYSRGVNLRMAADMLDAAKRQSTETAIPLGDANLWETSGKTYDAWVCTLTYSLVEHTDDTILRLCQDMLLMKASLAELVFPHVFGNLAGKFCSSVEFCTHISNQIEEHVFNNTNQSTRSLQLFLNMLNNLRQCYIEAGLKRVQGLPRRRENSKLEKPETSGGSRLRRKSSTGSCQKIGSTDNNAVGQLEQGPLVWNKVYWLHIDYLATAKAAQQCAAYFTSVLYVEHWCEEKYGSLTLGPPDFSSDNELPAHLELLVRVYTRINEPDGIYGVVRSHKVCSQLLRYEHEGNWSKALENYDLLLRSSKTGRAGDKVDSFSEVFKLGAAVEKSFLPTSAVNQKWQLNKGLMKSLQQKGCSHVLDMYSSGVSQQEDGISMDAEFKEIQFEEAWRTGKWDYGVAVPISLKKTFDVTSHGGLSFHENLHSSFKSLREGDAEVFFSSLKRARQEIVGHIGHTSLESTQNVNPLIVKLQMLDCVSRAWKMRWTFNSPEQASLAERMSTDRNSSISGPLMPTTKQIESFDASWQENLKQMQAHYELAEPYIAIRKVLLELLGLHRCIPQHLLQFSSFARKAGRLNHAGSSIHELKLLCSYLHRSEDTDIYSISRSLISLQSLAGRVEEAKILWAEGQQEMAVNLAQHVLQQKTDERSLAPLLCLTGKWLAETRTSSSHTILDSYLKRAVELSSSEDCTRDQLETSRSCRTHYRLAHYADALYRNHQERLMSSEWQAALRLRHHKARELEALKKRLIIIRADPQEDPSKVREYSMKFVELHRQLTLDNEEAQRLQDDKNQFLILALTSYGSCLSISNKYDLRVVFRLVSLWFNLSSFEHVVEAMLDTVEKVQTYKFLPLVYQIASRLGSSKESQGATGFQAALTLLLEKMATDHPYHSLYQLFALANGDRIKEKQRGKNVFVVDMEKKRAAEELLDKLIAKQPELLLQIRKMIEIYIQLAELETTQKDANKKVPIPRNIRSVKELELVPVITASLPVEHSCGYSPESFVHFKGFTDGITVMNGINAPKCIDCLGSDGNKYRQLAKSGNDDMRQDAVMEQLFGLVNNLLQEHPDTQKRNLGIRTYKVIPFTPSAGVLEWVNGTIPLGEYLLGSTRAGGAHGRYGGDDWTFMMCREHMSTAKDKLTAFQSVCENFRPVMHHFFLEKFAQAANWFEKRLAYTRSVATSSMVGYIVGLGDRHSVNILMDQATAEVVHIDLGVAFEQGLMLKTPERVPFRLTRDIVDGMGVTGVEGVFRRVCEATLSVLRENKEALLTIIEVFIYDPLYNWALSPLKALQRQQELDDLDDSLPESDNMTETEGNKDAARALFRVKQKLDGYEEGEMRSLQGQVQQLIQDAQDPERLSQLFPGWGAWV
ncbi:serine-protein kinase ATM [Marchantia polymorpha subsp. ruderalis]|uniref:non-specific serine/threonine protein kinase n=1 Tax=Marchantia polymorpha TaxID=3197 RepID=A0A2R6WKE3_MARPO|nr:hypothetical protein MARPO_0081s0051 [Marchantia polymorpha]BBN18785.1 hypothetical protein Mp_8g05510 [Marchantia polymorpha subsp. ruderalis]|eukprot:PTQ34325.1 hypothetical protein MARPO_0081s0051 [Marchantia polymorpha]